VLRFSCAIARRSSQQLAAAAVEYLDATLKRNGGALPFLHAASSAARKVNA
jgi:hypothetical protein